MFNYCHCKRCKKAKRKGLILGSRKTYVGGVGGGMYSVSDYVPFPRFQPGRRPDPKFDARAIGDEQ